MDISKLTPEERNALTALVRSPGWALLMEKLFLPQMQLATQFLDRPQAEQSGKADYLRGIKASYANVIEVVYHVAGIESPLMRYALGLLANVRSSTEYDRILAEKEEESTQQTGQQQQARMFRARSNFPV